MGFSWEVIIVDDGSSDDTLSLARGYATETSGGCVRVLSLGRNRGKGAAVRAGMLEARGALLLMADADAATRFAEVELLESVLCAGDADVVVGSRVHLRGAHKRGVVRELVSRVFWVVMRVLGGVRDVGDTQCGFKLYTRRAAQVAFEGQHLERWAFDVENLWRVQRAGLRVREVDVRWAEVPGSKLGVLKAAVSMTVELLRMKMAYACGRWT